MSHILKLEDGRNFAYKESGVRGGIPVFFFHGTPGSRYFYPPEIITRKLGVRIITVDRPGYGLSDPQPSRQILGFTEDIAQLANYLHLGNFSVAGHSGGGPYVLACAYALSDRIHSAASICGAGPANSPGFTEKMKAFNKIGLKIGKYLPSPLWNMLIWFVFHYRSENPEADMERGNNTRPASDDTLLQIPEVRNACLESEKEAFRFGLRGVASDTHLLTKPWRFSLEGIPSRVFLWYGTADDMVPASVGEYLAGKIRNSQLKVYKDEGHLLLFRHWEEILTSLIKD